MSLKRWRLWTLSMTPLIAFTSSMVYCPIWWPYWNQLANQTLKFIASLNFYLVNLKRFCRIGLTLDNITSSKFTPKFICVYLSQTCTFCYFRIFAWVFFSLLFGNLCMIKLQLAFLNWGLVLKLDRLMSMCIRTIVPDTISSWDHDTLISRVSPKTLRLIASYTKLKEDIKRNFVGLHPWGYMTRDCK